MASTPETASPPHMWPVGHSGRPILRVDEDPDAIRVLTAALNDRIIPGTYVSDGAPVVVEEISGAIAPTAADQNVALPITASVLKPPLLSGLLAEHADVLGVKNGRPDTEITPPRPVLSAVLARRSWPGLPVLRRIISTPVLRPDGTLLQNPGYDPVTGFYLAANNHLAPVPDHPTPQEVEQAREFLLDRFLRDFPWRTKADLPNYLALLVTPLIRPMTEALAPFGLIDASMPGSGKTILTGCVGLLVGQSVQTFTDSEEELRKVITTVLGEPGGVIVFDNLKEGTMVNSAVLARLVTERNWSDRRMGTNAAINVVNDRLWLATGNNLRVGGDMASRSVWVRLDPNCPRPEARTGFTIPNLDSWILDPANRATVLRHLLIMILDWTNRGAPIATNVPQMRQFTAWAKHLGGFLEHHQIGGFLTNADENRELDEEDGQWREFLNAWDDIHGDARLTSQQLRQSGEPTAGTDPWAGTFPTTPSGKPLTTMSLGWKLRGQIDRWHGDVVLRSATDSHRNSKLWWVERHTA
ncbi:hypothetical protein [Amycolatopsis minnesotensis]|uniref:DNA primase/helicase n=1 Tax=Amycolatopsis minnesotensis TaxID=337894 RepID=A0ABN2SHP3_9PSEU